MAQRDFFKYSKMKYHDVTNVNFFNFLFIEPEINH